MDFCSAQVQAIGLQVLKTTVQRALIPEENTFVIFLVGEQIGDIFTLIQQMLKVFVFLCTSF